MLGSRSISQDLANPIRERNAVCKLVNAAADRPQIVAKIGFFGANLIGLFPAGDFDISISASAPHGMRADQIANYLSRMDSLTRRAVYLKNWRNWHDIEDDVRNDESTFRLPGEWRVALERVDRVQDILAGNLFLHAA